MILIRFPTTGKILFYQPPKELLDLKEGDEILAEEDGITEQAFVVSADNSNKKSSYEEKNMGRGIILRRLDAKDTRKLKQLKYLAQEYLPFFGEKAVKYNMGGIKVLGSELSFDGKKLTFYFSAEGRLDFRLLVADLAKSLKKAIRLQQVGVRDEARFCGGIGRCGQTICCSRFLKNIPSVTLDLAKDQEMITSSGKLSGLCGKLMCCLSYEKNIYDEMIKKMPRVGAEFKAGIHRGRVIARNILRRTVTIENDKGKKEEIALGQ